MADRLRTDVGSVGRWTEAKTSRKGLMMNLRSWILNQRQEVEKVNGDMVNGGRSRGQ